MLILLTKTRPSKRPISSSKEEDEATPGSPVSSEEKRKKQDEDAAHLPHETTLYFLHDARSEV